MNLNLNMEAKTFRPLEKKKEKPSGIFSLLQVGKSFLRKKQNVLTIK